MVGGIVIEVAWRQGGLSFWTPASESRAEVQIPRRGYSSTILDRGGR